LRLLLNYLSGAGVLIVVLWDVVAHDMLNIWLLLMVAVNIARLMVVLRFKRLDAPAFSAMPSEIACYHRLVLLTGCVGLSWGIGGVLFMQQVAITYQLFIIFMVAGMAAGAAGTYTASVPAYTAFTWPAILPMSFWLLWQGNNIQLAMGVMGLIFALLMWLSVRRQHQTLLDSLRLSGEKEVLIQQLQQSKRGHDRAQQLARLGHWELNLTNHQLRCSEEVYRMFDVDPEQFGDSYEDFLGMIYPDDRDRVDQAYVTAMKSHIPFDIEHRLLLSDGCTRWVHNICEFEYGEDGRALCSIGTLALSRNNRDILISN